MVVSYKSRKQLEKAWVLLQLAVAYNAGIPFGGTGSSPVLLLNQLQVCCGPEEQRKAWGRHGAEGSYCTFKILHSKSGVFMGFHCSIRNEFLQRENLTLKHIYKGKILSSIIMLIYKISCQAYTQSDYQRAFVFGSKFQDQRQLNQAVH